MVQPYLTLRLKYGLVLPISNQSNHKRSATVFLGVTHCHHYSDQLKGNAKRLLCVPDARFVTRTAHCTEWIQF